MDSLTSSKNEIDSSLFSLNGLREIVTGYEGSNKEYSIKAFKSFNPSIIKA